MQILFSKDGTEYSGEYFGVFKGIRQVLHGHYVAMQARRAS